MGRWILGGIALIAALLLGPALLSGGKDGAKGAGEDLGESIVDTAKDPEAVGDAAGKVVDPVVEVAAPWWDALYAQPWFWTAVFAAVAAYGAKKWWENMGGTARLITVGVAAAATVFTIFALFGGS